MLMTPWNFLGTSAKNCWDCDKPKVIWLINNSAGIQTLSLDSLSCVFPATP